MNKGLVNEQERATTSFECGKTGFYLTLFFHHLDEVMNKDLLKEKSPKRLDKLASILDSNHGCLNESFENSF